MCHNRSIVDKWYFLIVFLQLVKNTLSLSLIIKLRFVYVFMNFLEYLLKIIANLGSCIRILANLGSCISIRAIIIFNFQLVKNAFILISI